MDEDTETSERDPMAKLTETSSESVAPKAPEIQERAETGKASSGTKRAASIESSLAQKRAVMEKSPGIGKRSPPLTRITVDGYDGRHYVAVGRIRGKVKVRGQTRIFAEGIGFDLLFDREDVVDIERVREVWE